MLNNVKIWANSYRNFINARTEIQLKFSAGNIIHMQTKHYSLALNFKDNFTCQGDINMLT